MCQPLRLDRTGFCIPDCKEAMTNTSALGIDEFAGVNLTGLNGPSSARAALLELELAIQLELSFVNMQGKRFRDQRQAQ